MRRLIMLSAALSIAAPLHARPPMQPVSVNVSIADLDLANTHGRRVLQRRIAAAIERVCGSYANAPEQVDQMRIRDCRDAAMSSARSQIAGKSTSVRLAATAR